MVDFDKLVNRATIKTFGVDAVFHPVKSAPNEAPYPIRGELNKDPEISDEDEVDHLVIKTTFSVRLSALTSGYATGDEVTIEGEGAFSVYTHLKEPKDQGIVVLVLHNAA